MQFVWEPRKAEANARKHGVSFEEAASAFGDPFALEAVDLLDPTRMILIGMSGRSRVLFVVSLQYETGDTIRIISARRASPAQRRKYEEAP